MVSDRSYGFLSIRCFNEGVIHLLRLALGYNDSVQDSLDADANSQAENQEPEPDWDE